MFVDLAVAVVYLGAVFGAALSVTILVVIVTCAPHRSQITLTGPDVAVSILLTSYRVKLRREMNDRDKYCRAIHTDALMNWEVRRSSRLLELIAQTVKFFVSRSSRARD